LSALWENAHATIMLLVKMINHTMMLPTDNGVIPSATVTIFLAHCFFNLKARTMDLKISVVFAADQ
jgi:hypothetical protein